MVIYRYGKDKVLLYSPVFPLKNKNKMFYPSLSPSSLLPLLFFFFFHCKLFLGAERGICNHQHVIITYEGMRKEGFPPSKKYFFIPESNG